MTCSCTQLLIFRWSPGSLPFHSGCLPSDSEQEPPLAQCLHVCLSTINGPSVGERAPLLSLLPQGVSWGKLKIYFVERRQLPSGHVASLTIRMESLSSGAGCSQTAPCWSLECLFANKWKDQFPCIFLNNYLLELDQSLCMLGCETDSRFLWSDQHLKMLPVENQKLYKSKDVCFYATQEIK